VKVGGVDVMVKEDDTFVHMSQRPFWRQMYLAQAQRYLTKDIAKLRKTLERENFIEQS
jgi:hypothetical protein